MRRRARVRTSGNRAHPSSWCEKSMRWELQVGTTISSSSTILKLFVALSARIKDSKLSDLPRVE
ncbi:hypothetical protein EJB05_05103, partial [Eragrostis curvula]